ncbi:hypothetical protein LCM23_02840 [Cytobacillus kochii]|uniref:hypothetical protein n=1 Tax=Cytobacillus kochii TaxID=859143 RepID=UPI001CD3AAD2|nr:hypothetical protein [Cytobacillus kochii]MCA1025013.1 hypothetical protein [Cytobacillus kochii]
MKKVYFHPQRKKLNHMPVFTDSYHHEAITYFLRVAETLEPQLVEDLDSIIPLYSETEKTHEQQRNSSRSFIDNWDIFEKERSNSHLIELKNAIVAWAKKYSLFQQQGDNKTFLEIALWAIPDRRDHEQDIEDRKKFYERIGTKVPAHIYVWSITNVIYFEDESEATGDKLRPDKVFPFVFTPALDNLHEFNVLNLEPEANDYENVLVNYDMDVRFALKGDRENVKGYIIGEGWDPRIETWTEFEESVDRAYKKYKELYQLRTKLYMEKHGYIEGKQKRNKDHFEWLVRFQIQEWSVKEIADYYSKGNIIIAEDTIRKALVSTADLIGLELR